MSTHKTRQEKIIADLRRKLTQKDTPAVPVRYSIHQPHKTHSFSTPQVITGVISDHFYTDLRKTIILTSLIISFELLLYFIY